MFLYIKGRGNMGCQKAFLKVKLGLIFFLETIETFNFFA